jgi:hypothetical protein
MKHRRLPPIPAAISSPQGPIPVRIVKRIGKRKHTIMGRYRLTKRRIEIRANMPRRVQWHTLYHEQYHSILCDSGLHNAFSDEQQELLCDLYASARMGEWFAGGVSHPGVSIKRKARVQTGVPG